MKTNAIKALGAYFIMTALLNSGLFAGPGPHTPPMPPKGTEGKSAASHNQPATVHTAGTLSTGNHSHTYTPAKAR